MKKIAIIGAGPIGVETAVYASRLGFDVTLYERGEIGENVLSWGHVELFSPWSLNRSPWGKQILDGLDVDEDTFVTGETYIETYIKPLAATLPAGSILENTEVVSVTRENALKGDLIGSRQDAGPFRLHVFREDDSEGYDQADIVIDTSGALDIANGLGRNGLPALNDWKFEERIFRTIPNFELDRVPFEGRRVLVIGDGYSAITSLNGLLGLKAKTPATTIYWAFLSETPYVVIDDDPLPERNQLGTLGNAIAAREQHGVTPYPRTNVYSIEQTDDDAMRVTLEQDNELIEVDVDVIVANVGCRPNMELTRELQVHHCYASEGPMKLAASLLAQSGNVDCLQQTSAGVDTLKNPEDDFFVLGAKSYGRNSNFLLRVGFEQIEAVLEDLK